MTPAPSTITFMAMPSDGRLNGGRDDKSLSPLPLSMGLRDSVMPLRPYVAPSADPPPQGWSLSRRLTTLLQYRNLSVYGRFRLRWCGYAHSPASHRILKGR